jgi:hypothetical protein
MTSLPARSPGARRRSLRTSQQPAVTTAPARWSTTHPRLDRTGQPDLQPAAGVGHPRRHRVSPTTCARRRGERRPRGHRGRCHGHALAGVRGRLARPLIGSSVVRPVRATIATRPPARDRRGRPSLQRGWPAAWAARTAMPLRSGASAAAELAPRRARRDLADGNLDVRKLGPARRDDEAVRRMRLGVRMIREHEDRLRRHRAPDPKRGRGAVRLIESPDGART